MCLLCCAGDDEFHVLDDCGKPVERAGREEREDVRGDEAHGFGAQLLEALGGVRGELAELTGGGEDADGVGHLHGIEEPLAKRLGNVGDAVEVGGVEQDRRGVARQVSGKLGHVDEVDEGLDDFRLELLGHREARLARVRLLDQLARVLGEQVVGEHPVRVHFDGAAFEGNFENEVAFLVLALLVQLAGDRFVGKLLERLCAPDFCEALLVLVTGTKKSS